jgi:hypothetical protein
MVMTENDVPDVSAGDPAGPADQAGPAGPIGPISPADPAQPTAAELKLLLRYLNGQRNHVLGILDGLTEQQLRTAALPSGWTPRELVHHLAFDDEAFWFRGTIAGEQEVKDAVAANQDGWRVPDGLSGADVIALYRLEIERSNAIIEAVGLDAVPAWWPEALFGDWRLQHVRDVILHVMVETAAHAGHLDAARELIDGRQWLVLDS